MFEFDTETAPSDVDQGGEYIYFGDEVTIDITGTGTAWREITMILRTGNGSTHAIAIAYCAEWIEVPMP